MEGEESYSFNSLLDGTQAVRRGLEALRGEHENLLGVITQKEGFDEEHEEQSDESLLLECKEATLAESMNRLNGGLHEAELLVMILQYIGSLEGDKKKLRAQVRRLADENSWLRQELQRTQQQLQEVESEACKIKEEKQHLEYTISLSKTSEMGELSMKTSGSIESGHSGTEGNSLTSQESKVKSLSNESARSDSENFEKLHQYAIQHLHQGRHDVALSLCKKAVQEIELTHGRLHPDRANMMNIMVVIYREQCKLDEAVKVLLEVLEIREKTNGREHQTVASTLNNLSVLYAKLGEYKTAETMCRRALEIRQKLLGANHPDVAQQLVNLAALCQHLGKYEEVEWYYQRALEIYQTEFGPDDQNVIKTLNYLGKCHMKQGNLEAAEKVFSKVRSSVQVQDLGAGTESREQSSSPTLLLRTETPEPVKRSSPQPRPHSFTRVQSESAMRRKSEERNPAANLITTPNPQKGRSSVSSNVLRFFRWGTDNSRQDST